MSKATDEQVDALVECVVEARALLDDHDRAAKIYGRRADLELRGLLIRMDLAVRPFTKGKNDADS